jgi:pSer/pThr/pTyr-binding forkhead associated (FHA) protein
MAQVTRPYKRTFAASVGAGVKTVFGKGKQYYILEHKTTSHYHRSGESQEIVVDQAEIGRDSHCQVRYDDSFETVSRRHAAIYRKGNEWVVTNLSETNPTLVNGREIAHDWELQSGDEIQLSVGGPRLGFLIPPGGINTRNLGGIGKRTILAMQQGLLIPYKRAVTALGIILALVICGVATWIYYDHKKDLDVIAKYEESNKEKEKIAKELEKANEDVVSLTANINDIKNAVIPIVGEEKFENDYKGLSTTDNNAIEALLPYIFYIRVISVEVVFPTGQRETIKDDRFSWSGTGFLLEDGRFFTARHVVEPWSFSSNLKKSKLLNDINEIVNNGGKVIVHFLAASSKDKEPMRFTNDDFKFSRRNDQNIGNRWRKIMVSTKDEDDWAYMVTNRTGKLQLDKEVSNKLQRGVELTVLGYPYGIGAEDKDEIRDFKPIYTPAKTASNGLTSGIILTTNTSFESGCSGGPAFYYDKNNILKVIGIVSAGIGLHTGFLVPVSSIIDNL